VEAKEGRRVKTPLILNLNTRWWYGQRDEPVTYPTVSEVV
jgi:hypothetical protein